MQGGGLGEKQKHVNKDKTVKCHIGNANMDIQLASLILLVVNIETKTTHYRYCWMHKIYISKRFNIHHNAR